MILIGRRRSLLLLRRFFSLRSFGGCHSQWSDRGGALKGPASTYPPSRSRKNTVSPSGRGHRCAARCAALSSTSASDFAPCIYLPFKPIEFRLSHEYTPATGNDTHRGHKQSDYNFTVAPSSGVSPVMRWLFCGTEKGRGFCDYGIYSFQEHCGPLQRPRCHPHSSRCGRGSPRHILAKQAWWRFSTMGVF
jgi:hypothetical protein